VNNRLPSLHYCIRPRPGPCRRTRSATSFHESVVQMWQSRWNPQLWPQGFTWFDMAGRPGPLQVGTAGARTCRWRMWVNARRAAWANLCDAWGLHWSWSVRDGVRCRPVNWQACVRRRTVNPTRWAGPWRVWRLDARGDPRTPFRLEHLPDWLSGRRVGDASGRSSRRTDRWAPGHGGPVAVYSHGQFLRALAVCWTGGTL